MAVAGIGNDSYYRNGITQGCRSNAAGHRASGEAAFCVRDEAEEEDLRGFLQDKISEIAEKVKKGDTEIAYQIGGQAFTEKEWNKLIDQIDKNIDDIKEEQEERAEKQEEERLSEEQVKQLLMDR